MTYLATSAQWGIYLTISLQHSAHKTLRMNNQYLFSSAKFYKFTKFISSEDHDIVQFFKNKAVKEVWNVKTKYFINKSMRKELNMVRTVLEKPQTFKW